MLKIWVALLLVSFSTLLFCHSSWAQERHFYQVAPKIFVPFNPAEENVICKEDELFVVALPTPRKDDSPLTEGPYAPHITPFGDKILFQGGGVGGRFSFNSVYLDEYYAIPIPDKNYFGASLSSPTWSIDKTLKKIAFTMEIEKIGATEIFLINSDGGGFRRVTHSPQRKFGYSSSVEPHLSEDGSFIVFRGIDIEPSYIGYIKTDGTGFRKLDEGWMPRGGNQNIALSNDRVFYLKGYPTQIWMVNLEGGLSEQVTEEKEEVNAVSATSSGDIIAYVVKEGSGKPVHLKVIDLSSKKELLKVPNISKNKMWEPWQTLRISKEGTKVLFTGQYEGEDGIFVFDLKKGKVTRIDKAFGTGHNPLDSYPDMCATGEIIVFEGGPSGIALAFLPDETSPYLWINTPAPMENITFLTPTISAGYQDKCVVSGIDRKSVKVLVNEKDQTH
ncbi:hypothetical protein H5U35_07790, partial [Candidatus Aerophobetes bacterium]|nr:hypothetical protein [Candidatus Aerophobetes bacterium]